MAAGGEIKAKLVYYGPAGCGMTANLECIHRKLKKGNRGDLKVENASGARYEVLPVQLGQVRGFTTSIHVHTVPGAAEHADVRRQIVRDADGIVFVADLRAERYNATLDSLRELQSNLRTGGRSLRDVLLVIQYNHRDESDENCVERLHRSIKLKPAASFEAVATEGTGVLTCLTTISKLILADLRKRADDAASSPSLTTRKPAAIEIDDDEEPESESKIEVKPTPATKPAATPAKEKSAPPPAPATVSVNVSAPSAFMVKSAGPVEVSGNVIDIPLRLIHPRTGDDLELTLHLSIG